MERVKPCSLKTRVNEISLPGLEITAAGSKKIVIGMPVNAEYCGTQRLLDMLTNPPFEEVEEIEIEREERRLSFLEIKSS